MSAGNATTQAEFDRVWPEARDVYGWRVVESASSRYASIEAPDGWEPIFSGITMHGLYNVRLPDGREVECPSWVLHDDYRRLLIPSKYAYLILRYGPGDEQERRRLYERSRTHEENIHQSFGRQIQQQQLPT